VATQIPEDSQADREAEGGWWKVWRTHGRLTPEEPHQPQDGYEERQTGQSDAKSHNQERHSQHMGSSATQQRAETTENTRNQGTNDSTARPSSATHQAEERVAERAQHWMADNTAEEPTRAQTPRRDSPDVPSGSPSHRAPMRRARIDVAKEENRQDLAGTLGMDSAYIRRLYFAPNSRITMHHNHTSEPL
jgi:hypothetical protein